MIDDDIDGKLLRFADEWNIAERRIKKAEMVRGGEVVTSAIFELRYAGRKIVDAFQVAINNDITKDARLYGDVREFIEDAIEDCVKAKHDAIDAMLNFVTIWFNDTEAELGEDELSQLFPNYIELTSRIALIQDKIAESRQDRHAGRNGIYDEIEKLDFDAILDLYQKMRLSEDRVNKLVKRRKFRSNIMLWATVIAAVCAVIALAVPVFSK